MGIFSKKQLGRELERVEQQLIDHRSQGVPTFVVTVNLDANGVTSISRDEMQREAIDKIQGRGYIVTDMKVDGWRGQIYLQVAERVSAPRVESVPSAPSKNAPTQVNVPAEEIVPAEVIDDPDEIRPWLRRQLLPWASPQQAGVSFGPGWGLEKANAAITTAHYESFFFEGVAQQVAETFLHHLQDGHFDFDAVDTVLGLESAQLTHSGVPRSEWDTLLESANQMKRYTVGLHKMDMAAMEPWFSSDLIKRHVYIVHEVTMGRLQFR